ncbi:hypothetical protein JCM8547_004170 [Rhodosporidiobolus lusitaniae]
MRSFLTLTLVALSTVAFATPSPAPGTADGALNLFGWKRLSSSSSNPSSSPPSSSSPPASQHANPPNVAWDLLGFSTSSSGAFSPSTRGRGVSRKARMDTSAVVAASSSWTVAPLGGGKAEEPAEAVAEGDESAEEQLEDDDEEEEEDEGEDDEGGDMLGEEGWFRKRSTIPVLSKRRMERRRVKRS